MSFIIKDKSSVTVWVLSLRSLVQMIFKFKFDMSLAEDVGDKLQSGERWQVTKMDLWIHSDHSNLSKCQNIKTRNSRSHHKNLSSREYESRTDKCVQITCPISDLWLHEMSESLAPCGKIGTAMNLYKTEIKSVFLDSQFSVLEWLGQIKTGVFGALFWVISRILLEMSGA